MLPASDTIQSQRLSVTGKDTSSTGKAAVFALIVGINDVRSVSLHAQFTAQAYPYIANDSLTPLQGAMNDAKTFQSSW
jgi:hypothetical protein